MSKRRIFVISNHLMFGHGIGSLLREEAELEVVGQESNLNRAIEQIGALQPDVVILDSDDPEPDLEVAHILRVRPGVKVISLSLDNNTLCVYQASQRTTRGVDDLLAAIA